MPSGKLAIFDEGNIQGSIDYLSMLKSTRLNAENRELRYPFYAEKKPIKAYILLITESKDNLVKWRLWLNNFSLTKEFKPNYTLRIGKNYISMHLFDVTPLVIQGKNEFIVNHASIDGISIQVVNSVLMYDAPEVSTEYTLKSGILLIEPLERIDFNSMEKKNYIVLRNPNKSKLKVMNSEGVITEVGDSLDSDEIEAEGNISIYHDSSQKNPAFVYLHYSTRSISPKIDISVDSKMNRKDEIIVCLENIGEVDLDKLIVNAMLNGVTINFKTFNNVKVGDKIEYSFNVQKKGNLHLRIVGVKSGLRKILDKDINW
ncbi:hypothetical protein DFR86_08575 [Acidianus sulfidivorans JP7]|uniref:Uncharacterized protein n=1 Tax=Acidianus sulfidivorans JP7 TaxID=619593 RepID=A0A2U9INL4_9CREN|nr:hypothetical protein [Acidianus sulfidivorans]AWR97596.1 hypothetical protein DFR86_08575 [Acidianus sulfidivorans JP7]